MDLKDNFKDFIELYLFYREFLLRRLSKSKNEMKPLKIALTSVCATLYAGLGYLTYLGIFTPVIGVVRFWPVVIVPAVFSMIFGPLVGGIGAAIGIFISDLAIHGNALLSLVVGVPANFICFYLIGFFGNKNFNWKIVSIVSTILSIAIVLIAYNAYIFGTLSYEVMLVFIGTCVFSYLLLLVIGFLKSEWRSYEIACFIGLIFGSLIIGFGVWGFSQFFVLPQTAGGGYKLPFYASLVWFIWTFLTEIPFLLTLGPPIISAIYKAFPSLKKA
ncbi:MAG: hypothetical protein QXT31_02255 [Candidatus Bathyarchaeia archaeon]